MNDFDAKWLTCAARARQADARDETPPIGFATRVLALAREQSPSSPARPWEQLTLASLVGVVMVLTICAVFEIPHFRKAQLLEPGIENSVAQLVWSL
jgi:hypothetical protein